MPNWDEAGSADDAFEAAVNWAQTVLERFIVRMQSAVKAENIVQTAIEQADDPRIVVLDTFAPWVQLVCKAKEPQFIIFPSNRGG